MIITAVRQRQIFINITHFIHIPKTLKGSNAFYSPKTSCWIISIRCTVLLLRWPLLQAIEFVRLLITVRCGRIETESTLIRWIRRAARLLGLRLTLIPIVSIRHRVIVRTRLAEIIVIAIRFILIVAVVGSVKSVQSRIWIAGVIEAIRRMLSCRIH